MVLVYLREGETYLELGAGFGVSTAIAWRYVNEAVMLLSARSPKLRKALAEAKREGLLYLVLDGTLIPIDRVRAEPYRGRNKPESQKQANRSHARLRGPGERANAQLKTWKILRKLRCCPHRAGHLAKAIHVLHTRELAAR